MKSSKVLLSALLALAVASPLRAQQAGGMPESYRQVQMNALRLQRRVLIAMADSMPERLYRDKVTPIQRDFAQQIAHAATSVPMVTSMTFHLATRPSMGDTAQYLNSRAGLKQMINSVYDWAENTLQNQSAADRAQTVNLFGTQMPGWQVWDEMHQHTFWTAGQIVANFRKNGMAPPGFGFF
jgi:hypothetical protein